MALIKCSECGKEFSEKASACPNCACPIELKTNSKKEIKKENEYIIEKAIISKKFILIHHLIIIGGIFLLISFFVFLANLADGQSNFLYCLFDSIRISFIATIIFSVLLVIPLLVDRYLLLKNRLILTNKRITGVLYKIFGTENIDIPIDKINAIFTTKKVFIFDGISISSAFAKTYHLSFVENAQEFKEKVMKEINERS